MKSTVFLICLSLFVGCVQTPGNPGKVADNSDDSQVQPIGSIFERENTDLNDVFVTVADLRMKTNKNIFALASRLDKEFNLFCEFENCRVNREGNLK
jgi:hypothetical protein